MIKLKVNGKEVEFKTTIFPDSTSQVWQIKEQFELKNNYIKITFLWENNEAEILHLCQLVDLIRSLDKESYIALYAPYLPFARQDKSIYSTNTFSLHTFAKILNTLKLNTVLSYDVHSDVSYKLINNFQSIEPYEFHNYVLGECKPDVVFFPDFGAENRYGSSRFQNTCFAEKHRNYETGEIISYKIVGYERYNTVDFKDKKILLVDDLVDAGGTFILAAKELKKLGVKDIALCTSHGLYSKGYSGMIDAGISKFYTTNSLIKNTGGFKVWE